MNKPEELGFLAIFGQLDDPRIERNQWHPMPEILLLPLGATRVGCADDRKHINREKNVFDALRSSAHPTRSG